MTDLEVLSQMFEARGIEFKVEECNETIERATGEVKEVTGTDPAGNKHTSKWNVVKPIEVKSIHLTVEAGYIGFCTIFAFNDKEELSSVEAYE